MVRDGKRTPEQAALSKEIFPFLDDPKVQAQLEQCGRQGAVDFNIFNWIVTPARAQAACAVTLSSGQLKYFTPTQAMDCLSDYRQMTAVVRGIIGATGAAVAGLAGAFLLASTTATGQEINQKFTGSDGSTVLVTGNGDQPTRQILVTYPDGTRASLTVEVYDDGGAVLLTSGMIGTQLMTPGMLGDMQQTLKKAGLSNVVLSSNNSGNGDQKYFPPPKAPGEITGFPGLTPGKPIGGRARWYDNKGNIYEWDYQHGALEKYDKTGKKHLGEYDPKTGKRTKPPKPGRSTKT
ncbi:hypothetical protein C5748_04095 [Phyllobacterium phragmitis]|uniref:Colicin E3-like ribonuclease domain-containing protein n=2 Tax=Phyllobacterium phragmitis TaxID=2670329 RepID=A0A2S9IY51_9HYPH|nr:hypothetical protein C5748_04095 [Phyllobacterium phragmitis]